MGGWVDGLVDEWLNGWGGWVNEWVVEWVDG